MYEPQVYNFSRRITPTGKAAPVRFLRKSKSDNGGSMLSGRCGIRYASHTSGDRNEYVSRDQAGVTCSGDASSIS